jgi:O-methyltransferase
MSNFFYTRVRPRIKSFTSAIGIRRKRERAVKLPPDFDELTTRIFNTVNPYTMTSPERVAALVEAVRYVVANDIPGDFIECGVWRGGSSMAAALTLKELGDESRELWLYDTYEGMSAPTEEDVDVGGQSADTKFSQRQLTDDSSEWCRSPIDDVRQNLESTGYPAEKVHFIKGKVQDTIPGTMPSGPVAILRLDTDWYESTRHEMQHLYPALVKNGVLILDDYGYWQGARKAVDEYFATHNIRPLMGRVDFAGRAILKP